MTEKKGTAFIGPSRCGKTTLIRCLNRMHEMTPGAYVSGEVNLENINIYDPKSQSGYHKKKNRNGISKTQSFRYDEYFRQCGSRLETKWSKR